MNWLAVDRRLADVRVAWGLAGLAVAASVVAAVLGMSAWRTASLRATTATSQLQQERNSKAAAVIATDTGMSEHRDFTARLPQIPRTPEIVQALHRACAESNVTLASLQAQMRPASVSQLARGELLVMLRGPYVRVRQVLDDVLGRHVDVGVSRLRMRRMSAGTDIEAAVAFSVWARPALPDPAVHDSKGRP